MSSTPLALFVGLPNPTLSDDEFKLFADTNPLGLFVGRRNLRNPEQAKILIERFREAVAGIPQILECHRLAGNFDYLLKVVVEDVEAYDAVYRKLIAMVELTDVSAYISMETIKDEQALPLRHEDR